MHADTEPRRAYLEAFPCSSLAAWSGAGDGQRSLPWIVITF